MRNEIENKIKNKSRNKLENKSISKYLFFFSFFIILLILSILFISSTPKSENKSDNETNNKSIILLIGDGMGLPIISAWDYYKKDSVDNKYSYLEDFDGSFLVRTRSKDKIITDSASAATAYATGYHVDNYQVGLTKNDQRVKTIMDLAKDKGKSTGIVVLCTLTHATPAAFYAYCPKRSDEQNIAKYLIYSNIDVAIGGGKEYFKNFIPDFQKKGYTVLEDIYKIKELQKNPEKINEINKLLAFTADKHPPKYSQRNYNLSDLSKLALNILSKNPKGFFLMIEASQIDWYGHENSFKDQIDEMKDYEKTIQFLLDFYKNNNKNNILILTLADHDCGGLTLIDKNSNEFNENFKHHYSTDYHTAEHIPAFYKGLINFQIKPIIDNVEVFYIMKRYLFDQ